MARSIYLVVLLLPACGGASLRDFTSSELTLDLSAEGRLSLSLGAGGSPGSCRRLDGPLVATVNGRELQVDSRGGEVVTTAGWSCAAPEFTGAVLAGDDADALVEVADGETRLVLLARNAFAPRRLTASGYDDWSFLWVPTTDQEKVATWRHDDETGTRFGPVDFEGGVLLLDLQGEDLARGTLRVDGLASTPIDRCEGVARCRTIVRASSGEVRLSGGMD